MISIPIAVNNDFFKLQLDLFWFNHKRIYGEDAFKKAYPVVVLQNKKKYDFSSKAPHVFANDWSCYFPEKKYDGFLSPLNMQISLLEIIDMFDNDEVIELIDCDMFHIKKAPDINVVDNEFIVSDIYENWHLKSNTSNKYILKNFLKLNHSEYNGGFVPIIGKIKTFKKILNDWINLHIQIFDSLDSNELKWWCGMYSFQVACANNNIYMRGIDICYIPNINNLLENHYISHYCCDYKFDKKKILNGNGKVDFENFQDNLFYNAIKDWYNSDIEIEGGKNVSMVRI